MLILFDTFLFKFPLQLQEVRSAGDGKFSLLHYFGKLLREKYPDLLNFYDELPALENAKRISLQTISAEVGNLRKGLRASQNEAEVSLLSLSCFLHN